MKKCLASIFLCIVLLLTSTMFVAAATTYKGASGWAVPELDKAAGFGFITDRIKDNMIANITREEFTEIAVKLYETYTGKTAQAGDMGFTDTTNPEVLKAAELKLVEGIGGNKFGPKQLVTREQMATILFRALKVIKPNEDYSTAGSEVFSDDMLIDSWAQEGVYYCSKAGIIKGIQNTEKNSYRFEPDSNSSREAAVIVCTRAYELFTKGEVPLQAGDYDTNLVIEGDDALKDWNESIFFNDTEFKKDEYVIKEMEDVTWIYLPYERFKYIFKNYDSEYLYPQIYSIDGEITMVWKNDQGETDIEIVMTVDSTVADINGEQVDITAGPYTDEGQVYVPVNLFIELFSMKSEVFQGRIFFSYEEDFSKDILTGTWSSSSTSLFSSYKDIITGVISLSSFEWSYTFNADGTYSMCAVSAGGYKNKLLLQSGKYKVIGRTVFYYDVYETMYQDKPLLLTYENKHMGDRLESDFIYKYNAQEDIITFDLNELHRIQSN